jgi:hypothetical protein
LLSGHVLAFHRRFVPIKTDDQLDLQAIHRVRDRLISRWTAVINQLRLSCSNAAWCLRSPPAKLKAATVTLSSPRVERALHFELARPVGTDAWLELDDLKLY